MRMGIAAAFAALIAVPLLVTSADAAARGGGGGRAGGGGSYSGGGGFHGGTGAFHGGPGGMRGGGQGFRGAPGRFRGGEGFGRNNGFRRGLYGDALIGGFGAGLLFDPAFDYYDDPFVGPYDPYGFENNGPPAVVTEPFAPQDLGPPPAAPPQQNWYYCSSPTGYYPYVRECNGSWQAVPSTPGAPAG